MIRTIEEFERENWGEPESATRPVVVRCLKLRRKPIHQFSVDDLRLMIGQDIGTHLLIPYALDILKSNPFAEGRCYPGDLLANVIRLRSEYWLSHDDQQRRAIAIAHKGLELLNSTGSEYAFDRKLRRELQSFIWQHERGRTYSEAVWIFNEGSA